MTCEELGIFRRVSVGRLKIIGCAFRSTDDNCIRLAQPCRRLDQRVEHRLKIERRATDDLEHVGGGGLLRERFAQLVEQARVQMTAWAATFVTSSICLSWNGGTSRR